MAAIDNQHDIPIFVGSGRRETNCFQNLTKRDESIASVNNVLHMYYGWLMLPFILPTMLFATIYALAVYKAIRTKRVYRKCFVLLLNRTIGDLLCCVAALINAIYVLRTEKPSMDAIVIMQTLFVSSFWTVLVSYGALSFLKLYAVWKPIDYRRIITMKRCIYLIVFSWIIFIMIVFITLTPLAMTQIPSLNRWSGCKLETCDRIMYRFRNLFSAIVYLLTIAVVTTTVIIVRKSQKFSDSFRKKLESGRKFSDARLPLWKLTTNAITFGLFNSFYAFFGVYMVTRDKCYFIVNMPEMMRLLALMKMTMIMRIFVDVLISFIIDYPVRYIILSYLKLECTKRLEPSQCPYAGRSTVSDPETLNAS